MAHHGHVVTLSTISKGDRYHDIWKGRILLHFTHRTQNVAAIDIGSNAIRLVIAEVQGRKIKVHKKYRIPIRLGEDVFKGGKISAAKIKMAARAFEKFSHIAQKYRVRSIKAVGTSALREASNRDAFIEIVRRKSQILVEIIDGVEEAQLIHLAISKELRLEGQSSILIDIGGGSVELTFSVDGGMVATQSFPFGTVRTLEKMRSRKIPENKIGLIMSEYVEPLANFIHSQALDKPFQIAIGTGGNLEALGRLKPILLKENSKTFISSQDLVKITNKISAMTTKERINKLKLRPDRADVIIPAALMVSMVLRQSGVERVQIPYVGLKEGLIWKISSQLGLN